MNSLYLLGILLLFLALFSHGWTIQPKITFKRVLARSVVTFGLLGSAGSALAKGEGTKEDKKFENCVAKCVFSYTKPPPAGASRERLELQMNQKDAIRLCKPQCAKTKAQLMTGEPKKSSATTEEITRKTAKEVEEASE
jgi:hypothetical protein